MPRNNTLGSAAMGIGGGPASVDGWTIITPGGGACWLNDHTLVVQTQVEGKWCVVAVDLTSGVRTTLANHGVNELAAGGDRWLGWANGIGLVGSLGSKPLAGLRGAGPDGTLAYVPDYQDGRGLVLVSPQNNEFVVPNAGFVLDLQVLGPRAALWYDGQTVQVYGRPAIRPALKPGRTRVVSVAEGDWLVYWAEGTGLVAQLDGASDGYVLESRPIAFNHDASVHGGQVVVSWSTTQGEGPDDLRRVTLDRTKPRRPLAVTPRVDVPRINAPLWLAGFDFGDGKTPFPGNAALKVVQGVSRLLLTDPSGNPIAAYVAGSPDSDMDSLDAAVAASKRIDSLPVIAYWTLPNQRAGRLPKADIVGVEGYRQTTESLVQFEQRLQLSLSRCWSANLLAMIIAQCYTSNLNNTTELATLVPIYAQRVIVNSHVPGILVFSIGKRATGWDDHPEVHAPWQELAKGITGTPVLKPALKPVDPPTPPKPEPVSPYVKHKELRLMDTKIVVLKGPGGKYGRADNPNTGPWGYLGKGWRGMIWDVTNAAGADRFELTMPDKRHKLVHATNRGLLGVDATVANIAQQFYLTPPDHSRGWAESPIIYEGNVSGVLSGQVEYDHDPALGKFVSCAFAVEVV